MRRPVVDPITIIYFLCHLLLLVGGVSLAMHGTPLSAGIGGSLAAAGVAGMTVWVYVWRTQQGQAQLLTFREFGLKSIFSTRGTSIRSEYDSRLAKASTHIDVMGFGLSHLREDYGAKFSDWARRAEVRILIIDPNYPQPDCSYAEQRDKEEGNVPGKTATDVEAFVQATANIGPRFKVRLMKCLPSVNIFRVDDELFWGPYLMSTPSRNSPTMIAADSGKLFSVMTRHFDAIWNDSQLSRDADIATL